MEVFKNAKEKLMDRMFSNTKPSSALNHCNSKCNFNNPPPDNISEVVPKMTKTDATEKKAIATFISLAQKSKEKFTLSQVMEYRLTHKC